MGRVTKNFVLQWGEMPTSVAFIGTGQIMGWGNKAIEVIVFKKSPITIGEIMFLTF